MENDLQERIISEGFSANDFACARDMLCAHCSSFERDPFPALKEFFGYDSFRTYNNEPLQENAVRAALAGESVLTIFPTGGGKSITFQLPALMEWEESRSLTVVISPLQSLMKDQVDNLLKHHITEAATINGTLTSVERARAVKRIENGDVAIVYVSPEQLRSGTFTRLLHKRTIARFVIDEAHCFSAWGHDFRVDYLYIGEYLQELRRSKCLPQPIPVSCFTATAKQQVINEITEYFEVHNGIRLKLFKTDAERMNLHYQVTTCAGESEKYDVLSALIRSHKTPTIVYVSRTARAEKLAEQLRKDRISACPFHGQMDVKTKMENQNAFIKNEVQVMVATSAFGMGVDKPDVGMVIHHDISSSLEAYLQESGRAGRDPSLEADCHLLYDANDLNEHFSLYAHAQVSINDVNRIWNAVKSFTRMQIETTCSAYELAKSAGWNVYDEERLQDIETRVFVCISALEHAGYLRRARNAPIPFASSLKELDDREIAKCISESKYIAPEERGLCYKIMMLLSDAHKKKNSEGSGTEEAVVAHTQIDKLSSKLKTTKKNVLHCIDLLREIELISDDLDITATIRPNVKLWHLQAHLTRFHKLESLIFSRLKSWPTMYQLKEINDEAGRIARAETGISNIRALIDFHVMRHDLRRRDLGESYKLKIELLRPKDVIGLQTERRYKVCESILTEILKPVEDALPSEKEMRTTFSVVSLLKACRKSVEHELSQSDVEDALLFMQQIGVIGLTGGFLIGYNRMQLERIVRNDKVEYTEEDYAPFRNFYRQKNEAVHVVGEYVRLMSEHPDVAKQYVRDYFQLDFEEFVKKHFKGLHAREITRSMTNKRYKEVFGALSDEQQAVIENHESEIITVVAGAGSGKTRLLVQKTASLLLIEEIPAEQLLMLTFTRAATWEFKSRLVNLVGSIARDVEVKTFHSYCMDVLGRSAMPRNVRGCADSSGGYEAYLSEKGCVACARELIVSGRAERHRVTKCVLLIDEAQDMGNDEYALVRTLMELNPDMRVIAVGDDDQNIYKFRGASIRYFRKLASLKGVKRYELTENHRSAAAIVDFTNAYASVIKNRLKRNPSIALSNMPGRVDVVEYASEHMEERLVNCLIENQSARDGTCAVLAQTNIEAVVLAGILLRRGIRAKLIQCDDRIKLRDLAEMRYFIRHLNADLRDSAITSETWENACGKLYAKYAQSTCLGICRSVLEKFKAAHDRDFVRGEFEEFLNESSFEDFQETQKNVVIVSTLYKVKGREFDSVYLFLKNLEVTNDDQRRMLIVAMTRAGRNLFIHCNTPIFAGVKDYATSYVANEKKNMNLPEVVSFMLTHHDMNLGYFGNYKNEILRLKSGDVLSVKGDFVFARTGDGVAPVGKFSNGFVEQLRKLGKAGYVPIKARVSFVLAWRGKDDEKESAILLPFITLERKKEAA